MFNRRTPERGEGPWPPGETLRARLLRERRLSPGISAGIAAQVAAALAVSHAAGISHGDLRPEIILLEPGWHGPSHRVSVLGRGTVAARRGLGELADPGERIGYLAPEHVDGAPIGMAGDVWALGVVLYESLSGFRPLIAARCDELAERVLSSGITPIEVVAPTVPRDLAKLVARMLARSIRRRPSAPEAAEVLAELARTGGG
jgi:eukaryotic-like serine/threonine-protein kinase